MNRRILHIAIPSIISNVTVPLLSLVDTTIVGHLGAAAYIGAIALGGMVFNMIYWLFGFLRMGTGGLTAQAFGADDRGEAACVLGRSLSLALVVSLTMLVFHAPILDGVFRFVTATEEVECLARTYFNILIWGAPAVLGLYSFTGWFLGMQNAKIPMAVSIVQNVVNVTASLILVLVFRMKVEGVAWGTLIAQYAGFVIALGIWLFRYRQTLPAVRVHELLRGDGLGKFFLVNRDIFLRTLCLIGVSTYFTSAGSAQGELVLAANALLMQFFTFFSYVMDGFAYAGEALGGRYCGGRDIRSFDRLGKVLFVWGAVLALSFAFFYFIGGETVLSLLTDKEDVRCVATEYLPYVVVLPLLSVSAFLYDGLFIGLTATRQMLVSMFLSMTLFFCIVLLYPHDNAMLWTAFLAYLFMRGVIQKCLLKGLRKLRFVVNEK